MRCERCGYKELVPLHDLEILRYLEDDLTDYEDHLLCPLCLHDMYRADSKRFARKTL